MEMHSEAKQRSKILQRLAVLCLLILVVLVMGPLAEQQGRPQLSDTLAESTTLKAISTVNTNPTATFAPPPTVVAYYAAPQPTIQSTPDYADSFWATVVAIKQTLPTASPIPGLPPDKAIGFQDSDLERRASGTALVLYPPPAGYYPPTPMPDNWPTPAPDRRPAGAGTISNDVEGSVFSIQLLTVNYWWETMAEQELFVFAGSEFKRFDPLQGEVLVGRWNTIEHKQVGDTAIYLTPSRHGKVEVIDAVGERLTLRADDGTLFYFDVPSRQWVSP